MKTLRRQISLRDGVEVQLLFTPHLYAYRGFSNVSLEFESGNNLEIMDTYKDIMFLAAVNAWELDGLGTKEDFPYKRGDFHEWAMLNPKEFGAAMAQAITGLTGKTIEELAKEHEKKTGKAEAGKKKESATTGLPSKRSWWANAVSRLSRRGTPDTTSTSSD